ncbi:hypothetical protein F4810DRAFT_718893 [Camillea tinctor]|nr:hypothetical protein F4810DRAFT_718893 [Camillea tinctor]
MMHFASISAIAILATLALDPFATLAVGTECQDLTPRVDIKCSIDSSGRENFSFEITGDDALRDLTNGSGEAMKSYSNKTAPSYSVARSVGGGHGAGYCRWHAAGSFALDREDYEGRLRND